MEKAMNIMKENGFVALGGSENYHMNWKTLENFMPEKAEILKKLWVFRKEWPIGSSIPVYDISSGKIYPSAALDRMGCYGYDVAIRYNVLKSIDTGLPVKGRTCKYQGFDNVCGHVFMAIEDVPTKIIKEAVRIETEKENDDGVNNFINASRDLDKALKEAKELLK